MSIGNTFTTHASTDNHVIGYKYSLLQRSLASVYLEIKKSDTGEVVYTASEWNPLSPPYFSWNGKYKSSDKCAPDGLYDTKLYLMVTEVTGPYAETVEPQSIRITGCDRVEITAPPDNQDPLDATFATNFSFLSTSSILARAAYNFHGSATDIAWEVTAANGELVSGRIRDADPADMRGQLLLFFPAPPEHPDYTPGTENPSDIRYRRSTALSYRITARLGNKSDANTITQDQKDTIIQEYVNHGITEPTRTALREIQGFGDFTRDDVINVPGSPRLAYSLILGNPAQLAQAIQDEYNRLLSDDVQVVLPGSTVPNTVIVRPAPVNINTIGTPVLDTPPCYPSPDIYSCDDTYGTIIENGQEIDVIVDGGDGIAQTQVYRGTHFRLQLNSSWRNPERNEAVGSTTPTSRHQYGDAVDLKILGVPGVSKAEQNCILKTAAQRIVGISNVLAEEGSIPHPCNDNRVDHIHAERN